MQDVMTHVFSNTTVTKQGYATMTTMVRGNRPSLAPNINQGVRSGEYMLTRLDEVRYYTASGAV